MKFYGPLDKQQRLHQQDSYPFLDPDDPDQDRMREERARFCEENGIELDEFNVKPAHISDSVWERMKQD